MNPSTHPKLALLQEAIASALSGDKQAARESLKQVTIQYPENELGWLWLASVAPTPQETMRCWRHAYQLNPQQEQAVRGLKWLLLQEGIYAARENRQEEARELLSELIQFDADNEVAWLWLATLARDIEEAACYTARVLQINPHNERARVWMEKLQLAAAPSARTVPESAVSASAPKVLPLANPLPVSASGAAGSYTILVVDDSPTIRKLVKMTLEKYGHQVFAATNGLDALNQLKEVVPDLILSDINMPHMDGYQLCKMIRGNAITHNVPVVMLSGKDGIFDKLRGRLVGATAYITKPFEIDSLLQLIDMHCQQAQGV